jgi:iron complex transport system substrate-binding protein
MQTPRRLPASARPLLLCVIAGLLLSLALACGGDDGETKTTTASAAPVAAAASPASSAAAGAATPASSPVAQGCREVKHQLGTACVPTSPKRIVALDALTVLPTLLDLGATVVGSTAHYPSGQRFPHYLPPESVKDIQVVGTSRELDLEKIVALRPDLIVGWVTQVQPVQQRLEAIAPTVATPFSFYNPDWRSDVLFIGDLVGKRAQVAEQLAQLDQKSERIKTRIAGTGRPFALSRADIFQGQALYYRYDCTWFGEVLKRAGVSQPAAQQGACTAGDPRSATAPVSAEQYKLLDGDAIVTYLQPQDAADPNADPIAKLSTNPLWPGLAAVQARRVFALGDAWGLGAGIRAANIILDDLESKVLPPR